MLHSKLLEVTRGIGTGLSPDLHDIREFVWIEGENVRFTGASVAKSGGWAAPFTATGSTPVRGIGEVLDSGGQNLFWGNATNLYNWDVSSVSTVGSSFSGINTETALAPCTMWSFVEWGNWCVASNGVDPIQIWKGSGNFAALGGTPPSTAEILIKSRNYVLALNTDQAGNAYEWSDTDDVEDWVPLAANRAGDLIIRDLSSEIIAGVTLGGSIAVYARNEMAVIDYVGDPLVFGHRKALKGVGAFSKYSVVEVGRRNLGMCADGFFETDGVSFKWLGEDQIVDTVYKELNLAHKTKICAMHDAAHNEVRWYYPAGTATENSKAVVYNYKYNTWSFLGNGKSAVLAKGIFSYPISGDSDGDIFYEEYESNANDASLPAYVQSKATPMYRTGHTGALHSLEDQWKFIEAIKVAVKTEIGSGLNVSVGVQDDKTEEILWVSTEYDITDMNTFYPEVSARWVTIKLHSDQVDSHWEVQGLSVHGTPIGGPPS